MFWRKETKFSNGCAIKLEIFAVGSRDEWYSMIVTICIKLATRPTKGPSLTLLTAPIVLELVYIEFDTDPSPSDCYCTVAVSVTGCWELEVLRLHLSLFPELEI